MMTEAEWDACKDPDQMLKHLAGRVSGRKLRLFACACCRRAWHLLPDARCRAAVAVAERFADGQVSRAELDAARVAVEASEEAADRAAEEASLASTVDGWIAGEAIRAVAFAALAEGVDDATAMDIALNAAWSVQHVGGILERNAQAGLVRDLFGNPFRSLVYNPACRTSGVVALAQAIYEEGRFKDLPILGDALEDAGCGSPNMLGHCRSAGPHVKGCWLVDLLLARQ